MHGKMQTGAIDAYFSALAFPLIGINEFGGFRREAFMNTLLILIALGILDICWLIHPLLALAVICLCFV